MFLERAPIFLCNGRNSLTKIYSEKETIMLKIRLQGTMNDIKWFLKILKRDRRFITNTPSDPMEIKGTVRYHEYDPWKVRLSSGKEAMPYGNDNAAGCADILCG